MLFEYADLNEVFKSVDEGRCFIKNDADFELLRKLPKSFLVALLYALKEGFIDELIEQADEAILNDDIIQNESCWSILTFLIIGNFLKNKALFTLLTEIGGESFARCQFDLERIKDSFEANLVGHNELPIEYYDREVNSNASNTINDYRHLQVILECFFLFKTDSNSSKLDEIDLDFLERLIKACKTISSGESAPWIKKIAEKTIGKLEEEISKKEDPHKDELVTTNTVAKSKEKKKRQRKNKKLKDKMSTILKGLKTSNTTRLDACTPMEDCKIMFVKTLEDLGVIPQKMNIAESKTLIEDVETFVKLHQVSLDIAASVKVDGLEATRPSNINTFIEKTSRMIEEVHTDPNMKAAYEAYNPEWEKTHIVELNQIQKLRDLLHQALAVDVYIVIDGSAIFKSDYSGPPKPDGKKGDIDVTFLTQKLDDSQLKICVDIIRKFGQECEKNGITNCIININGRPIKAGQQRSINLGCQETQSEFKSLDITLQQSTNEGTIKFSISSGQSIGFRLDKEMEPKHFLRVFINPKGKSSLRLQNHSCYSDHNDLKQIRDLYKKLETTVQTNHKNELKIYFNALFNTRKKQLIKNNLAESSIMAFITNISQFQDPHQLMAQIKTQIGSYVTFTQGEQRAPEALDPKQKTKQIIFNITSQAVGTIAQGYVIEKMKTFKKILNQSTSERVVEIHEYATEALSQLNKLDPTKKDDKAKIIKAFFDQVCPESPPTVSCPPGENVVWKPIQGQVGGAQIGRQ